MRGGQGEGKMGIMSFMGKEVTFIIEFKKQKCVLVLEN